MKKRIVAIGTVGPEMRARYRYDSRYVEGEDAFGGFLRRLAILLAALAGLLALICAHYQIEHWIDKQLIQLEVRR